MLFSSLEYAWFLPLVFIIYWFVVNKNLRLQNCFVVAVSFLFYAWWDWRFLILIVITILSSYYSGLLIHHYLSRQRSKAKLWAVANIVLNVGILCVFKYLNFFTDNLQRLFELFGFTLDFVTIDILLPIGISFYTFQAIGYTIDMYRGDTKVTRDIVAFFAYVSFFPQLVAGPIERSNQLLPQFLRTRTFDYAQAVIGMRQILWGVFKKIVIADNCAYYVNNIYSQPDFYSSSTLVLGGVLFCFQVYGDFSGYSDIAIGTARLFGVQLTANFRYPFFSRDVTEFWRRWHISLMYWFRDYIFFPMGGSRCSHNRNMLNLLIVFAISGLWHGAEWTFVLFGLYNALLFIPYIYSKRFKKHRDTVANGRILPTFTEIGQMFLTFVLFCIGLIMWRSPDIPYFVHFVSNIFTATLFTMPSGLTPFMCIIPFMVIEWVGRNQEFPLYKMPMPAFCRWAIYWILLIAIVFVSDHESTEFIYFQF